MFKTQLAKSNARCSLKPRSSCWGYQAEYR